MDIKRYGLIGQHINYSLSPEIFRKFFSRENLPYSYEIYNLAPAQLENFILQTPLSGFNITIPYKQKIIPLLDALDNEAAEVTGVVNCVAVDHRRHIFMGYNTDAFGFHFMLRRLGLPQRFLHHVLILGNGATARTIRYVMEFYYQSQVLTISRQAKPEQGVISYNQLDKNIMDRFHLIVNTTPLGGPIYPGQAPRIPYQYLNARHVLLDLNYRPAQTRFMRLGMQNGAQAYNGLPMLVGQAYRSWEIWKKYL